MFTVEERDRVRDRVLAIAQNDPRVTSGALIGSTSGGEGDRWSDIDITFGITDDTNPETILDDWTAIYEREFGALHYWDLPFASSVYRVFLLPSSLEIDVSVTPQKDFARRGSSFRLLFGKHRTQETPPLPSARYVAGLCWHHLLHVRSNIERGKLWSAEYWIGATRDQILTLACLRFGEPLAYRRHLDRLPASVIAPLEGTLVRSLNAPELRRALGVITNCFLDELRETDAALAESLKPVLLEYLSS